MARRFIFALLSMGVMLAQDPPEPPEEDEALKSREYALNPVQAKRELTAGNFYFKKGNYRAAAGRYLEATRWDPGWAEAFLKWGETSEKLNDYRSASEAFRKYFELAEDDKSVASIKKRMAKWPRTTAAKPGPSESGPLDSVPDIHPPPPRTHR